MPRSRRSSSRRSALIAASAASVAASSSDPKWAIASSMFRTASSISLPSPRFLDQAGGHDLRLVDQIARPVQDPVDAAREREHVLGLERGDEGCAERAQQFSLCGVASMLSIAHCISRRGLPGGPGGEASSPSIVTATCRRSRPSTSGVSGRNQCGWSCQPPASPNKAVASDAVTGIVTSQARPIWRTTAQCT